MMRNLVFHLTLGVAIVVLAGCAITPSAYTPTPDGAKQFVLTMRAGAFSPNYFVVNHGDRVRLVISSYYQFAFFNLNQFNINRMVSHDAPEVVEFVATQRGWFDFTAHAFYSSYARLALVEDSEGGPGSAEHVLYGRLYVQ